MEKVVESSKFGSEVSSSCSILEREYKMNESFIFTATIHNLSNPIANMYEVTASRWYKRSASKMSHQRTDVKSYMKVVDIVLYLEIL